MLKEAVHIVKIRNNIRYLENYIVGFLLISAKEGIWQYENRAADAILKEFTQLDDIDTFLGTDLKKLTRTQKKKALKALSIITEKRNKLLKGRTYTDGYKQRQ